MQELFYMDVPFINTERHYRSSFSSSVASTSHCCRLTLASHGCTAKQKEKICNRIRIQKKINCTSAKLKIRSSFALLIFRINIVSCVKRIACALLERRAPSRITNFGSCFASIPTKPAPIKSDLFQIFHYH